MSLEALKGTVRAFDAAGRRRPQPPRPAGGRRPAARAARRQRRSPRATRTAARSRTRTRCAACPRSTAPPATSSASPRAVLEREANSSTDNPLVFIGDAAALRRDDLRRQLPRPAGRARPRRRRDGGRRARQHQRAPGRAAGQPAPLQRPAAVPRARQRPQLRLHDRAGQRGGAGQREQGPRPPGVGRLDPVVGRPRGPRLDGRDRRAQARRRSTTTSAPCSRSSCCARPRASTCAGR